MTRSPDEEQGPRRPGGNAAERLRQFLAERFGGDAPPIPPDEVEESEEKPTEAPDEGRPGSDDQKH